MTRESKIKFISLLIFLAILTLIGRVAIAKPTNQFQGTYKLYGKFLPSQGEMEPCGAEGKLFINFSLKFLTNTKFILAEKGFESYKITNLVFLPEKKALSWNSSYEQVDGMIYNRTIIVSLDKDNKVEAQGVFSKIWGSETTCEDYFWGEGKKN